MTFDEAFAKLSPADQQQAEHDRAVYGRCVIYVSDDGRVELVPPYAVVSRSWAIDRHRKWLNSFLQ